MTAVTPTHCVAVWQLFLTQHAGARQPSTALLSSHSSPPFYFPTIWRFKENTEVVLYSRPSWAGLACYYCDVHMFTLKLLRWGNFRFPISCTLHNAVTSLNLNLLICLKMHGSISKNDSRDLASFNSLTLLLPLCKLKFDMYCHVRNKLLFQRWLSLLSF